MSSIRKALEARTTPELHPINLDPYPGTVEEVADEIARFVLELERAGIANGLAGMVRDRLERDSGPVVPHGSYADPFDQVNPAWMPGGRYCVQCDTETHVCPGCGASIAHGTYSCEGCK